jgi:glucose/arabinose dehydrogenase
LHLGVAGVRFAAMDWLRGAALIVAMAAALLLPECGGSGDDTATVNRPAPPRKGDQLELVRLGRFSSPVLLLQQPSTKKLFVVEREGSVVPVDGGRPLLDISERVSTEGEAGMLSAVFAPDGRRLYVAYSGRDAHTHVDEFEVATGETERREVLTIPHPNFVHWGGLLAFGPDRRLYMGTGDGGPPYPIPDTAQDPDSLLGKLLRIDPETGNAKVVAMGLRNPWRYSFDRKTGDIWIGDVGDFTQEEVDHVAFDDLDGSNFGWPELEGTEDTTSDLHAKGPLTDPVLTYERTGKSDDPVCAVTGGFVVRDPDLPGLAGDYVYGDFCQGMIRAAPVTKDGGLGRERRTGLRLESLASFAEDEAGHLYAISLAGPVYRLVQRASRS